jgi:hypothetical protein
MGRDRAAYMREYRAKKREIVAHHAGETHLTQPCKVQHPDGSWSECDIHMLQRLNAELEAEVRHLKAELARRPPEIRPFNSRPFTPVPKK